MSSRQVMALAMVLIVSLTGCKNAAPSAEETLPDSPLPVTVTPRDFIPTLQWSSISKAFVERRDTREKFAVDSSSVSIAVDSRIAVRILAGENKSAWIMIDPPVVDPDNTRWNSPSTHRDHSAQDWDDRSAISRKFGIYQHGSAKSAPGRDLTEMLPSGVPRRPANTEMLDFRYAAASSSGNWVCLRDNVTGLIWAWERLGYSSSPLTRPTYVRANWWTVGQCQDQPCSVEAQIEKRNAEAFCGQDDWRVPSVGEIEDSLYSSPEGLQLDLPGFNPDRLLTYGRNSRQGLFVLGEHVSRDSGEGEPAQLALVSGSRPHSTLPVNNNQNTAPKISSVVFARDYSWLSKHRNEPLSLPTAAEAEGITGLDIPIWIERPPMVTESDKTDVGVIYDPETGFIEPHPDGLYGEAGVVYIARVKKGSIMPLTVELHVRPEPDAGSVAKRYRLNKVRPSRISADGTIQEEFVAIASDNLNGIVAALKKDAGVAAFSIDDLAPGPQIISTWY